MEKTPSSPAKLAVWIDEQIEYVAGVLETYDLSLWGDDNWGPARRRPTEKSEPSIWGENVRAGNRLRIIDADLRRFAAGVCPAVVVSLLKIDHSPFREAHKVLANLGIVRKACDGRPGLPPTNGTQIGEKSISVNDRMKLVLLNEPDAAGWSIRKWANALGCAKSTIHGTELWESLHAAHCLAKVSKLEKQEKQRGLTKKGVDRRKQGRNLD